MYIKQQLIIKFHILIICKTS